MRKIIIEAPPEEFVETIEQGRDITPIVELFGSFASKINKVTATPMTFNQDDLTPQQLEDIANDFQGHFERLVTGLESKGNLAETIDLAIHCKKAMEKARAEYLDQCCETAQAREQMAKMKLVLLRIGWPKRGTADETRSIEEFANEIQDSFEQWDLDDNYDGAPSGNDRAWPQAPSE